MNRVSLKLANSGVRYYLPGGVVNPLGDSNPVLVLSKVQILDMLLKSPVREVVLVHVAISAGILTIGLVYVPLGWVMKLICFFSGLALYTLAEYAIHRFFLHSGRVEKLLGRSRISHLVHHEQPNEICRLDLDLVPSVALIGMLLLVCWVLLGFTGFIVFSGFLSGYIGYELVHYGVHFVKQPSSRIRRLWAHHAYHHYADHTKAYGVTTPIWDMIFGTMPKRGSYGKRKT